MHTARYDVLMTDLPPAPNENRPDYFNLFETCKLVFRTLDDIEKISDFAKIYFADRPNVVTGLYALALNAVEHGNLEIGYHFKGELLVEGRWKEEIERRLTLPAYRNRSASLVINEKDEGTYIIISDSGDGFDWSKHMAIDPTRAGQKHGRGIAIAANLGFTKLSYNEQGNQVVAFVTSNRLVNW